MTCPGCGHGLAAGVARCPGCGAVVSPAVEGSLAPEVSPAARNEPLRELPGLRRRERTWKDEVKDRVRKRRQQKKDAGLPLFERETDDPPADEPGAAADALDAPPVHAPARPAARGDEVPDRPLRTDATRELDVDLDLPLHGTTRAAVAAPKGPPAGPSESEDDPAVAGGGEEWSLELSSSPAAAGPVERPALVVERLHAAALDLGLLAALWGLVVYFASRAAQVSLAGLAPSAPWLVGYLAALGALYAASFTGATGRTPGKMATGLRVVDVAGQPPGFLRALLRVALGALGTLGLGLGLLPMLLDPARRAFHDRVLQTRVIKR